jgi:hypothetical protein
MSHSTGTSCDIRALVALNCVFLIEASTGYSGWAAQRRVRENAGSHDDAAQSQPGTGPETEPDWHPGSSPHPRSNPHPAASRSWMFAAGMDMLFLLYCWVGVRGAGRNLLALGGGWREVAGDFGIALPFWVLWEAVAYSVYLMYW